MWENLTSFADANTGVIAIVLSTVSLFLAFFTILLQRAHNHRSIRPVARIGYGDYTNRVFVNIKNHGLGPMIIDRIEFYKNGKMTAEKSLVALMPKLSSGVYWETFSSEIKDRALAAGDKVTLISFKHRGPSDHGFGYHIDEIREALSDIRIKVFYRDLYNYNLQPAHADLSWFRRYIGKKAEKEIDSYIPLA